MAFAEARAKFIIHSLRQLVLLECMHDDFVNFRSDRAFRKIEDEADMLANAREGMREDDDDVFELNADGSLYDEDDDDEFDEDIT